MIRNSRSSSSLLTPDEESTFEQVFENLASVLVDDAQLRDIPQGLAWMGKVLRYNVPHGRKLRGKLVAMTYKSIVKNPSKDQMYLAYVLGWVIEMLQGSCLIADDIMDNSFTRRGQPCWYLVEGVGNSRALNDAFLLEQGAYRVLQKYFRKSRIYPDLLELFHDISYKTVMGQSLDSSSSQQGGGGGGGFADLNMERYKSIVKYKTGYYTIYLPIAVAMRLAGIRGERGLYSSVETTSLLIGQSFQVRDDYADCFGMEQETGKVGTDIQNGKCTWLIVIAKMSCSSSSSSSSSSLQLLSDLEKHYGSGDELQDGVARVKEIYAQLGIPSAYKSYQEGIYGEICEQICKIDNSSIKETFWNLVSILFPQSDN